MDNNTSYLLKQYGIAVFLLFFTAFGLISAVRRGEFVVPLAVMGVVAALLFVIWATKRKTAKFFLDPTPDLAVAYYHRTMLQVPNGKALCAYMCGLRYSFYGEYDKARDELANVAWASLPPMYDGFRIHVLSIISILEKNDYRKALDLALEARDLCEVGKGFPGSNSSKRALNAHVLACELLTGIAEEGTPAKLELLMKKLPVIARVIPTWSLVQYYRREGEIQSAEVHSVTLSRLVPNCKPLVLHAAIKTEN